MGPCRIPLGKGKEETPEEHAKRVGVCGATAEPIAARNFVRMIAKEGTCKFDEPVSVVMTRQVFTVDPSQSIEDCMIMMTEKRIRHLPVVENDQIVGMISIGDVIKGIVNSQKFTIDQLTKYIGGGYNQ